MMCLNTLKQHGTTQDKNKGLSCCTVVCGQHNFPITVTLMTWVPPIMFCTGTLHVCAPMLKEQKLGLGRT